MPFIQEYAWQYKEWQDSVVPIRAFQIEAEFQKLLSQILTQDELTWYNEQAKALDEEFTHMELSALQLDTLLHKVFLGDSVVPMHRILMYYRQRPVTQQGLLKFLNHILAPGQ